MGAVPTPATQTAGLVVAAATINSQGNLATYLAGRTESGGSRKPLCVLRQTVAQSLASGASTALTFDVEDVDYDNGHSTTTNTSRYTAGTAGWYHVDFGFAIAANATGQREAFLKVTGVALSSSVSAQSSVSAGDITAVTGSRTLFLNVADYVEVFGYQNSGGALNTAVTAQNASYLAVALVSV